MNRCPRDGERLASNDVSGYRYYSCERCGGYWIPGASLNRALSIRGIEELRALSSARASELRCPDCRGACEAIDIKGCTLDCCGQCHGVWLDTGEVRRVSRLFPEGSAVVDADANRAASYTDATSGAICMVDAIANVFLLVLR